MPQKQPPASTAVSSPAPGADVSVAGGGMVRDSARAASGLKARVVARSRAEPRIMICIPRRLSPAYRDEFGAWLHTDGTRLRERVVMRPFSSHSGARAPRANPEIQIKAAVPTFGFRVRALQAVPE